MFRKILVSFVFMVLILSALYVWKTKTSAPIHMADKKPAIGHTVKAYDNSVHTYTKDNLKTTCDLDSPNFGDCHDSKLPKFIFMSDESLQRPTEMSFEIAKIKPINDDLVEIHTDSTCNGNWFGLCQGRVIYVLVPSNGAWRVKDIYAIEL